MPLEDLDLVFEDEDEQKKKRSDAMHVDVDLEFGANEHHASTSVAPKAESSAPKAMPVAQKATGGTPAPNNSNVKNLDDARNQVRRPTPAPSASPTPVTPVTSVTHGSSAMQLAPEMDFASLTQELEETKFTARVQVAVAEHKGELLAEVLSDMKLLDHQVHQLLVRINQKHPELKPEVMAIKKLLADFAAKKRK